MRKLYLFAACMLFSACFFIAYQKLKPKQNVVYASFEEEKEGEDEGYDGPRERDSLEFEKIKDPALGYVPANRLGEAIDYTENQKTAARSARIQSLSFEWTDRGPVYDSVGPSNGNGRGGNTGVTKAYTSGRIRAVLVDTLNDPTGNTVFAGGVAGGLWKCTNFLSSIPNWQPIDDRFDNLAVSSICQDPSNPRTLYFASGEATSNADAVYGGGIWKSIDGGTSWRRLSATTAFIRNFKIICDAAGNVYLAARPTITPAAQPYGLLRSTNGGTSWTNITPKSLSVNNAICTDVEISSTGRLHASFGYASGLVTHRYSDNPATVTGTTWNSSTGIRSANTPYAYRLELAVIEDTLYAVTVNSASNTDSIYKSINGGATWTRQNIKALPTGVLNGQGWYNLTLAINPSNTAEIMVGGLDAYRSKNNGDTLARVTYWVGNGQYVHADHHFMQWWNAGGENRLLIGCDGGLFLSQNGGTTWTDKNRNLSIKQFYSAAIHPNASSPYLLAGAQDNGVHQLKNAGSSYSIEVTGGDGAFVHINQKNPSVQFGSYVYNNFRRSTNGGQSWGSVNFSSSNGLFINPYDYDDSKNILYSSWKADTLLRWVNANTSTSANLVGVKGLGTPSSFKVSPYTVDRVFVGSNSGKLFRLDNAASVVTATNITGASFPTGFLNCINVGSNDDHLVAVFTNYGVNNVWYSKDAGATWFAIDGNLPDMPVRWAVFVPGHNDKLVLATEAGVYTTQNVDGANTVWTPDQSFPTVRTDMLKIRTSDNTIVAATHGRGLFTATIPTSFGPEVNFTTAATNVMEQTPAGVDCRSYKDYTINVSLDIPATGDAFATINVAGNATAKKGFDYDFTTNGNFTAPSNELEFTAGQAAVKPVILRIYDDGDREAAESLVLELSVSGTTNATAGYSKTHVITINDDDKAPQVYGLNAYEIGTYNGDANATSPLASNRAKHKMQALYSAAELRAAGLYPQASISSMTVQVLTKNSTKPYKGFTISLANTATTTLTAGFTSNGTFIPVYSSDFSSVEGDNTFAFNNPFVWDGTSNIVVQYCFDNDSLVDAAADIMAGNAAPLGVGVRASTYSNQIAKTTTAGCALNAALVNDFRINATFGATSGNTIAKNINTKGTQHLNAGSDVYYYTPAGDVIARIRNLGEGNFGCTNVVIDRAGNGASKFWNSNKENFLMDKTFQVVPSAGTSGPIEVTFYYTKEEKEGWEAITGQPWENIQLVKVPSKISEVTPQSSQQGGAMTTKTVNASKGTFGDGFTLTAVFEDGFGGFGAGMPGRMYNVLVNAHAKSNSQGRTATGDNHYQGIEVSWKTQAEVNSTFFEVEKSYDGINFHKLTAVKAARNATTETSYSIQDKENVQVNYYRIKMLHTDGFVLMSNTVRVLNEAAVQHMFVLTNPFKNNVRVRFAKVPSSQVTLSLYDMSGKLVQRSIAPAASEIINFDLSTQNLMSKGVYILDVVLDGQHYRTKLMKE